MPAGTLFDVGSPQTERERAKALGAFYTDARIAEFLVWWAVRSPRDMVMDPSFGGGVFLRAACKRLARVGGDPSAQVLGVEIDPRVHGKISEEFFEEFGIGAANLRLTNFFRIEPNPAQNVDVIVGNPPFIRYQRFSGNARKLALECSLKQGVRLPELCSSWAPFLVHCVGILKQGGRLAMVVPMEIAHAKYALPVLDYLRRSFNKVTFLTFQKKLFSELSEDTLLLLAEEKGSTNSGFFSLDLPDAGSLAELPCQLIPGTCRLDSDALSQGRERLIEHFITREARVLYRSLSKLPQVRRLGDLAQVGIGYVTGANTFFHLSPAESQAWGIPKPFLRPAVRRGRSLCGLRFTTSDWEKGVEKCDTGYLLHIARDVELPPAVRGYLKRGEAHGIPNAYKCRSRSPWYRVPHVYQPDAFLSYMSGTTPRLVANEAAAVAPNSLHIVRFHPLATLTSRAMAALWQTSLTRLSVEIDGHALGGGMLKIEPTEARNVLLPVIGDRDLTLLDGLTEELDALVRAHRDEEAQMCADAAILRNYLGLSRRDCILLQEAGNRLRSRRYGRSAAV